MTCSTIADGFNGFAVHLANHDVMLWAVSRAPLAKLQAYKRRLGWTFPWASSFGSDFNADYSVGFGREDQKRDGGIEYNYRREDAWKPSSAGGSSSQNVHGTGVDWPTYLRERPGVSAFALEGDHLRDSRSFKVASVVLKTVFQNPLGEGAAGASINSSGILACSGTGH